MILINIQIVFACPYLQLYIFIKLDLKAPFFGGIHAKALDLLKVIRYTFVSAYI